MSEKEAVKQFKQLYDEFDAVNKCCGDAANLSKQNYYRFIGATTNKIQELSTVPDTYCLVKVVIIQWKTLRRILLKNYIHRFCA